ncbi:hypothetical protein A3654_14305 [Corynebacterium glutamicum]|nr:hypothetical protein A3654_14305 [Corynebacterium glutamicum]
MWLKHKRDSFGRLEANLGGAHIVASGAEVKPERLLISFSSSVSPLLETDFRTFFPPYGLLWQLVTKEPIQH